MDIRSTLFCSLLAIGTVAHAEGFYVLGSFGQTRTDLKDISKGDVDAVFAEEVAAFDLSFDSKLDRTDTGYKLQVGYQFSPNFAIEGGYVDLGETSYKMTMTDGVDTVSDSFKYETDGWNLEGVLILPVNAGVSILGKLGVVRTETTLKIPDFETEKTTKVGGVVGVGVAWNFVAGLSARVEWERYLGLGDDDEVGTKLSVDLVSVGLSYQF